MDILDAIDAAVGGCGRCGDPLGDSPSDYFCGPDCQESWNAARSDELVGYREPWDRPDDFPPGVIPPEAFEDGTTVAWDGQPGDLLLAAWGTAGGTTPRVVFREITPADVGMEFRLPRSTGNLAADWGAARRALLAATTDEQRAAVRLRMESLIERQRVADAELAQQFEQALAPVREVMAAIGKAGAVWLEQIGERMRPLLEGLRRAGLVAEPPSADPWERALAARRNRNTGPQQRRRPPRSIGRVSSSGRC